MNIKSRRQKSRRQWLLQPKIDVFEYPGYYIVTVGIHDLLLDIYTSFFFGEL